MAAWPTLKEVRTELRLQPDADQDSIIADAVAAAIDYGVRRLNNVYPADVTNLPDAAHRAATIHASRLYKRRDSLDGTVGWGDLGVVRVGRVDPDVATLYDVIGPVVFG